MAENRKNVNHRQNGRPISKKAARARKKKRKMIILIIELLVLLIVLAGLWVMLKLSKINEDRNFDENKVKNENLTEDTQDLLGNYDTIALFGLDNRSNGNYDSGNSDVMMIARIDKETKEVKLVSIYRDTYLNMVDDENEDTYSKANAAYAVGGPDQAVRMLNTNWDLNITDYVAFDFNAVATAIDILGGVEIELSQREANDMRGYQDEIAEMMNKDTEYIESPGTYNLDGIQATSYGRLRYVGNGDFERTERQRLVLSKMIEKALASDVGKVNKLIDTIFPEIKTSLSKTDMLGLASSAFSYHLGDTMGFPTDYKTTTLKINYIKPKQDCIIPADLASNVKQLHEFLYGVTDYTITPSVQNISDTIVNNTGITSKKEPVE
ncbi:MAG: LCP family protein [Lachnospiraceae bacterium]